jgi:uncharacterized protein YecT (DUF1311 family)
MRYLILLALFLPLAVRAAEDNPINTKLDACLAKPEGQSTHGMVDCIERASAAYDRRLNEVYVKALAALDQESKEKLRASQRAWLAFRKAEEAVYGGAWRQDRGTIMQVTLAEAALSALKERVHELEAYVDD